MAPKFEDVLRILGLLASDDTKTDANNFNRTNYKKRLAPLQFSISFVFVFTLATKIFLATLLTRTLYIYIYTYAYTLTRVRYGRIFFVS